MEEESYNTLVIRELLAAAFDADELRIFCCDRSMFRPVGDRLSPTDSIAQVVDKLIAYCEKQLIIPELLHEVKSVNHRQYSRYQDRLFRKDDAEHLLRSFSAWMLVEDYLSSMQLRNCKQSTISEFRKTLWAYFLDIRNTSLDVSLSELKKWVAAMYERGLALKTIAHYQGVLRLFFDFAVAQGYLPSNPVNRLPRVKASKKLPTVLSSHEVRAFFEAIDATLDLDRGPRDRLLFRLIYTAGLAVGEVVALRVEQFDLQDGTVEIQGTRLKERLIPLRPEVLTLVRDWIGDRRVGWLFPGMRAKEHLSTRLVEHHCQLYGEAAGIRKHVNPSVLRNSCATHYLAGGAPITAVQEILGHTNLNSTGRFASLADDERARIARQTPLAI